MKKRAQEPTEVETLTARQRGLASAARRGAARRYANDESIEESRAKPQQTDCTVMLLPTSRQDNSSPDA